ncbi:MAG: polyprenyl synthetase family protein [Candidatus Dormibacterales bacterium]
MTETADLFGPVAADLELIEGALMRAIDADPAVVAAPMAALFEAGGKRIRPALVLLAARCGDYDPNRLTPAAMAVELTHAATLVHDDVIDRSKVRRGRPTVAARLGDEAAIVVGDYYFAKAYEQAALTASPDVVAILARTVMKICAGEVRQQATRFRFSTGIAEYMERIEAKTATLVSACCDIGALLGGLDGKERSALHSYGRQLGLAFQIADDLLDYTGSEGEVGKPIGHDVAEGFATLPLMLAREDPAVAAHQLAAILDDGRKLTENQASDVVRLVRASQGPKRALERARNHAAMALGELVALPPGAVTQTLAGLSEYVVSRKL